MSLLPISVVVSTYNWPEALRATLMGFNEQTQAGFEVIVADDGSTEDTQAMLEALRPSLNYPLIHSWQEDDGYRLARSRNLAVSKASGDYLVFIDGDCIPRPSFIERHRLMAERGCFASGNRIKLPKTFSEKVLAEQIPIHRWSWLKWMVLRFTGLNVRLKPLLYLRSQWWRKYRHGSYEGATGFSLAFWAADYKRVNGFEENYEGWGREDTDIVVRLMRAGVIRKEVRYAVPVFHLWHQEVDRGNLTANDERLEKVISGDIVRAESGLNNHQSGA